MIRSTIIDHNSANSLAWSLVRVNMSLLHETQELTQHPTSHLKRSNAIRIKARNLSVNPIPNRIQASSDDNKQINIPTYHTNIVVDEHQTSLLDQIKQGVQLQPVNRSSSRRGKRCIRFAARKQAVNQEEALNELLARVLRDRFVVMQHTDDESELSSIDSQPDQYDTSLEDGNINNNHRMIMHVSHPDFDSGQLDLHMLDNFASEQDGLVDLVVRLWIILTCDY